MTPTPKDQHADDKAEALEYIRAKKEIYNSEYMDKKPKDVSEEMNRIFSTIETALSSQQCQPCKDDGGYDAGFDDGHTQGLEEGREQASEFHKDLWRYVYQWLEKRNLVERGEEYTAHDVVDILEQHEKEVALHASKQPSNTPPFDALERAKNDLKGLDGCDEYNRSGYLEDFYHEHLDTIRALIDAAISQKPVDACIDTKEENK